MLVPLLLGRRWLAPGGDGMTRAFPYYALWSLEKGFDSTHVQRVAQQDWWRLGARWLLEKQEQDGSWQIESDVRGAVSLLGRFSVQEVVARFGRAGPQLEIHSNLVRRAVEMMVFKPPAHYEQWFPMAVELVLPILAQLRQSMGIATHMCVTRDRQGTELLPTMDLVRAWSPADGDLHIRLSEVNVADDGDRAPEEIDQLLQEFLAKASD
mgnify:CR=1 FL=1